MSGNGRFPYTGVTSDLIKIIASELTAGAGPAGRQRGTAAGPVGFTVELSRSSRTIPCEPGTFILDAALRAGITLPSSCGEGKCGTCKSTLVSGSVDMRHNDGIRPREIDARKILLCCPTLWRTW